MCSLFVCFMLVFNDPTSPTPYPVDAKGPVHHPQSFSRGKHYPRFLQLHSGRQREAVLTPGCLGMYCYANVIFTRGCWVLVGGLFVCFVNKNNKRSICGHPCSICDRNLWLCIFWKGKGGKRWKKSIYIFMFFPVSVSMVSLHLRGKQRRGSPGQHSEGKRDLPDPALWQV